jgi:hypothetical protein
MKVYIKVTLNTGSVFDCTLLEYLNTNKAGDLKRLAYEGILFRQFLRGFCILDQPAKQIGVSPSPRADDSGGNVSPESEQSKRDIALRSISGDF